MLLHQVGLSHGGLTNSSRIMFLFLIACIIDVPTLARAKDIDPAQPGSIPHLKTHEQAPDIFQTTPLAP
jgi:hypothetical protein